MNGTEIWRRGGEGGAEGEGGREFGEGGQEGTVDGGVDVDTFGDDADLERYITLVTEVEMGRTFRGVMKGKGGQRESLRIVREKFTCPEFLKAPIATIGAVFSMSTSGHTMDASLPPLSFRQSLPQLPKATNILTIPRSPSSPS